jgi:hypothetical protein
MAIITYVAVLHRLYSSIAKGRTKRTCPFWGLIDTPFLVFWPRRLICVVSLQRFLSIYCDLATWKPYWNAKVADTVQDLRSPSTLHLKIAEYLAWTRC